MAAVLLDEVRLNEGALDRQRLAKVEGLLEESHKHVATREDVQAVRTELVGVQAALQSEIAGVQATLQSEIAGVRSELKSEIAGVRSELADVKSDIRWLKWLLGIGVSLGVAIGAGVLLLLLRMAGGL